jgi:hypothetical protein
LFGRLTHSAALSHSVRRLLAQQICGLPRSLRLAASTVPGDLRCSRMNSSCHYLRRSWAKRRPDCVIHGCYSPLHARQLPAGLTAVKPLSSCCFGLLLCKLLLPKLLPCRLLLSAAVQAVVV